MRFELIDIDGSAAIVVERLDAGTVILNRHIEFSALDEISHVVDGFESLLMALAQKHDLNAPDMKEAIMTSWEGIFNNVD